MIIFLSQVYVIPYLTLDSALMWHGEYWRNCYDFHLDALSFFPKAQQRTRWILGLVNIIVLGADDL